MNPDFLSSYTDLKVSDSTKKIKVFLYTNAGALKHDSSYTFGVDYQTDVRAMDAFTDALWYLHHRLQTADTTLVYLFPYTDVIANTGSLYAYPDSALQADPKYANFQAWFDRLVTGWMVKHECTECSNIVVSPGTSLYFSKITCLVN